MTPPLNINFEGTPTIFIPRSDETDEDMLARLNRETGNRFGYGRSIEISLAEFMQTIENNWNTIVPKEFKVGWIPVLANNTNLDEAPALGPYNPETNITNATESTNSDNPTIANRWSIRYKIAKDVPAGFDRKMFSGTKELKPRLRFWLKEESTRIIDDIPVEYDWWKVKGKTNEYLIKFICSARTQIESDFLYKCLNYICHTNEPLIREFGFQRFIPLGSSTEPGIDQNSSMYQRTLQIYVRNEEYYFEGPYPEITQVQYDWDEIKIAPGI